MVADSNRPALALGLPWLYWGLVALTLSVGLPALFSAAVFENLMQRLALHSIATVVGVIGLLLAGFGLWVLARARIGGRPSPWLVASAGAWSVECLASIAEVSGLNPGFAPLRSILASFAMFSLCQGIPWLFDRGQPRRALRTWRLTRRLFAAQLVLYALVPLVSLLFGRSIVELARSPTGGFTFGVSLFWIVFAAPFLHLLVSLRRTLGRAPGGRSVEDILRG
jgi:hypothetical protein